MITVLTLFGGLASTVCWPLSAYMVETLGWRGACAAYGLMHLLITLPLYLFGLPREPQLERGVRAGDAGAPAAAPALDPARRRVLLVLVAVAFTLFSGITSGVGVNLLALLQAQGLPFATAVALGTIVGPSQVGARIVEIVVGSRFHPVWTLVVASLLITAGFGLLFGAASAVAVGLIVYGAGNGLTSIARGTVPLALFGAEGYATLMGWLGRPLLIAFAVTPSLVALVLDRCGPAWTLAALAAVAAANLVLGIALLVVARAGSDRHLTPEVRR
jgi:hypothetical protein